MEPAKTDHAHVRSPQTRADISGHDRLSLDDLGEVPMHVEVLLGFANLTVRAVLELAEGTVIPLRRMAGEMPDVFVNGMSLARGEIVVIGDGLSVRIAEVTGGQSEHTSESA